MQQRCGGLVAFCELPGARPCCGRRCLLICPRQRRPLTAALCRHLRGEAERPHHPVSQRGAGRQLFWAGVPLELPDAVRLTVPLRYQDAPSTPVWFPPLQVRRMQNEVRRQHASDTCMDQVKLALTPIYEQPGLKVGRAGGWPGSEVNTCACVLAHARCMPAQQTSVVLSQQAAITSQLGTCACNCCRIFPATPRWLCWLA